MNLMNPFVPNAPFFYPQENIMAPLQSKWACHSLGESLLRQNFYFENIQDDLFGIWKKIKTSARRNLLINKRDFVYELVKSLLKSSLWQLTFF